MIEYKVFTLRNYDAVDTDDLNVLAREGWCIVTCCHITGQGIIVIMSREVQHSEPKRQPVLVEKGTAIIYTDGTV